MILAEHACNEHVAHWFKRPVIVEADWTSHPWHHNNVGGVLWARRDTTQVMLGVSLQATWDTTLVVKIIATGRSQIIQQPEYTPRYEEMLILLLDFSICTHLSTWSSFIRCRSRRRQIMVGMKKIKDRTGLRGFEESVSLAQDHKKWRDLTARQHLMIDHEQSK